MFTGDHTVRAGPEACYGGRGYEEFAAGAAMVKEQRWSMDITTT